MYCDLSVRIIVLGKSVSSPLGFTQYVGKGFSGTTTDIDGIALAFYNTLFAFGGWLVFF